MNGETQDRPTNKTPMIYTGGDFITPYPKTEEFIKELADLYNKYGIDSKLNMRDFLLAEMSYNFLAVMHNTMRKESEMRDDTEGKALLYAVDKTAKRTKSEMIKKAKKYLQEKLYTTPIFEYDEDEEPIMYVCASCCDSVEEFISDFKKAMQDESK